MLFIMYTKIEIHQIGNVGKFGDLFDGANNNNKKSGASQYILRNVKNLYYVR